MRSIGNEEHTTRLSPYTRDSNVHYSRNYEGNSASTKCIELLELHITSALQLMPTLKAINRREPRAKQENDFTSTHAYRAEYPSWLRARRPKEAAHYQKCCDSFRTFQKSASKEGRACGLSRTSWETLQMSRQR